MKNIIEVNVLGGEIESYMIPIPSHSLVNLKITLHYKNGLFYHCKKENVGNGQVQYYLGFLTGVVYGQVIKDMLITENEIDGKLIIESEDVIL